MFKSFAKTLGIGLISVGTSIIVHLNFQGVVFPYTWETHLLAGVILLIGFMLHGAEKN